MDKLKQCAIRFQSLFEIEYKIILGKRNRETYLTIDFSKEEFCHLMGLHKLKDISNLNIDKGTVFDRIIAEDITYDMISKSSFFDKDIKKGIPNSVRDRIDAFLDITDILDSKNIFFKYSENRNTSSKIRAEFLLETIYSGKTTYTFLTQRSGSNSKLCESFFPKDGIDYSAGQASMTLLYKEKLNKMLDEHSIQFIHSSIVNKKFIAVRYKKIKKRVTLQLRYFNIEISAKTEEKAKINLAKVLVEYYLKYLEGDNSDKELYSLIQSYENSLSTDFNNILEKIIVI